MENLIFSCSARVFTLFDRAMGVPELEELSRTINKALKVAESAGEDASGYVAYSVWSTKIDDAPDPRPTAPERPSRSMAQPTPETIRLNALVELQLKSFDSLFGLYQKTKKFLTREEIEVVHADLGGMIAGLESYASAQNDGISERKSRLESALSSFVRTNMEISFGNDFPNEPDIDLDSFVGE